MAARTRSLAERGFVEHEFTTIEPVATLAILGAVAIIVLVILFPRGRCTGGGLRQCTGNPGKNIYYAAAEYAEAHGEFPITRREGTPRAHDSLNLLVRSKFGRLLRPEHFDCPTGDAGPAQVERNKFVLEERTLVYAWTAVPLQPGTVATLACDKYVLSEEHGGHSEVFVAVFTDGMIEELTAEDLQEYGEWDAGEQLPEGLSR